MSGNDSSGEINRKLENIGKLTSPAFGAGRGLTQLGTESRRTPAEKLAIEAAKKVTEGWRKSSEEEESTDTKDPKEPLEGKKAKRSTSFKDELKGTEDNKLAEVRKFDRSDAQRYSDEDEDIENDTDDVMKRQKEFFEEAYEEIKTNYEAIKNKLGIDKLIERTGIKPEDIENLEKEANEVFASSNSSDKKISYRSNDGFMDKVDDMQEKLGDLADELKKSEPQT
jgi:hypothetical protein